MKGTLVKYNDEWYVSHISEKHFTKNIFRLANYDDYIDYLKINEEIDFKFISQPYHSDDLLLLYGLEHNFHMNIFIGFQVYAEMYVGEIDTLEEDEKSFNEMIIDMIY